MKQEEKFEVAVAAFEALLHENKLWKEYFTNFNHSKSYRIQGEIYTSWKEWLTNAPMYQWLSGAFIWDRTQQGHSTWRDLDYEWLKWICKNLNK